VSADDFKSASVSLLSVTAAVILMAGIINGTDHAPSYFTLARDHSTRVAMESILDDAPTDALVMADWHWSTALWYLQRIEGQRPDIQVRYVYPIPGQEYPETWQESIAQVPSDKPLIITHYYDLPGITLEPLGHGFAVHERPYTASLRPANTNLEWLPQNTVFRQQDSGVRILGFQLSNAHPVPGQTIELTLAWQSVGQLTIPPSFSAKLVDQDGRQLAQSDRFLGTDFAPEEVRFERLVLPLYPTLVPGDYLIFLQVYSLGEDGFENWSIQTGATQLDLTTLPIGNDPTPTLSLHSLDIPFFDGPTLIGVDYDRSVPHSLRVYLHWQGPAQGGARIYVDSVETRLPILENDTYQTLALDLPGETHHSPQLRMIGVDGEVKTAAGSWGRQQETVQLPTPPPDARFVMLTDGIALIGVSPGEQTSFAPGDQFLMRPTFLALKPLVNDYAVSVRLLDETGQWIDKHDLQPGLGALPTLKWIQGSRISDPHPLSIPIDIVGQVVRANLVVYENFRGITLTPLDGRMEQVPLGEWQVMYP
jgi:hypothetical protein